MSDQHEANLMSLIEAVVNGTASADEHRQLEGRMLNDEAVRDAYLNYVNLHASLNRWFLAEDVATSLEGLHDFPLQLSREHIAATTPKSRGIWWTGTTLVLFLLALVSYFQWPALRSFITPSAPPGPEIVRFTGDIQVTSADGAALTLDRTSVSLGTTLVSYGDEAEVALRYPDGTEIVLLGSSTLKVRQSSQGGKELHLQAGLLQANVAPQPTRAPLLIVTPQARVRVVGTEFELAADAQEGTRLDLESGRVELVRGEDKPVEVGPNSIAYVPSTKDPIRVSARPDVVDAPLREVAFRGLKSIAFADDGETIIAGTRWQALYWYEDDRLEAIPLTARGREGISLRHQNGSLLVFRDHHDDEVVIWDAQSRQPLGAFNKVAALKQQFDAKDRPEAWKPLSDVALVSPEADWLAFQVGRQFRLWQAERGHWLRLAQKYDGKFVSALASSPDGKTLAVAVRRDKLDLIDLATGDVSTTWSLRHRVPFAMEFSADGKRLAVALAGHVAVHDSATGEELARFDQPALPLTKVAISGDGRYVAAASLGERVWTWDTEQQSQMLLLDIGGQIRDLEFSRAGRLAVLSRSGQISLWAVGEATNIESTSDSERLSNRK